MSNPSTITVTFGRNVGTDDMLDADAWARFQARVLHAVETTNATVVFNSTGHGMWTDEATGLRVDEESCCIVAVGPITARTHADLEDRLAVVAWIYDQDAIGLAVGPNQLIAANPNAR